MQGRSQRWSVAPEHPAAADLAGRLKVSPILAQALLSRGLAEPDECRSFLQPNLKSLHEPHLIPGILRAAERIAVAIREKQRVIIYGDYDVDGITATTILWHAIKLLGGNVCYYIPHRVDEGYGLNSAAIAQIIEQGAQLIITVDCGITAIEPAQVAADRGVDLIITDHHHWHEGHLPNCHSVVHPRLPVEGQAAYPNPHLCGAGVAFKLAWQTALAHNGQSRVSAEFREFLIDAMALAALGTIADVVPLVGENRVLAHFGLTGLRASKLTGIRALIASASLSGLKLDSYDVGFKLAPRLNACGRMGHAALAVKMFTEATPEEAAEIAAYLETQNRARQSLERDIVSQAIAQLEERQFAPEKDFAIVLGSEKWHAGVIGIVAARLVEKYCRPTVMVAFTDDTGQGSARSIPGFHLAGALSACGEHLVAHGGHEMAAGLKVRRENFDAFRDAFADHARRNIQPAMMIPQLNLDAAVNLGQLSEALVNDLHRLGPFGNGNVRPLFCFRDIQIAAPPRVCGKESKHLQIMIRQGNARMKCIAWGQADLAGQLKTGTPIELAAEPTINDFSGFRSVELVVKDLRATESSR